MKRLKPEDVNPYDVREVRKNLIRMRFKLNKRKDPKDVNPYETRKNIF